MIRKVVDRRFNHFGSQAFELGDHVVLAGPNNMGWIVLLQAVAVSRLAELAHFDAGAHEVTVEGLEL